MYDSLEYFCVLPHLSFCQKASASTEPTYLIYHMTHEHLTSSLKKSLLLNKNKLKLKSSTIHPTYPSAQFTKEPAMNELDEMEKLLMQDAGAKPTPAPNLMPMTGASPQMRPAGLPLAPGQPIIRQNIPPSMGKPVPGVSNVNLNVRQPQPQISNLPLASNQQRFNSMVNAAAPSIPVGQPNIPSNPVLNNLRPTNVMNPGTNAPVGSAIANLSNNPVINLNPAVKGSQSLSANQLARLAPLIDYVKKLIPTLPMDKQTVLTSVISRYNEKQLNPEGLVKEFSIVFGKEHLSSIITRINAIITQKAQLHQQTAAGQPQGAPAPSPAPSQNPTLNAIKTGLPSTLPQNPNIPTLNVNNMNNTGMIPAKKASKASVPPKGKFPAVGTPGMMNQPTNSAPLVPKRVPNFPANFDTPR
ncbi:hypothetical protein PROFUN_06632 [Planoprotostelium fungivorum]|uniref:Uncharacterized protein n=1 Tax=Planoprotostelium fungivorum TaxID=1890364 RepID=A0A2P6MST4_9EUKA|nr:hypothetical protein PROFUN_06632 [Planoprotostelium fungivorum]